MDENTIYRHSILTYAFTNDGKIITRKDAEGKLDTLPWLFMGYHPKDSRPDYEGGVWVMNNPDEYKEKIATFFAYYLKNARQAIINGFFVGDGTRLLDVGELNRKIAKHQIEEMKTLNVPSFIRVNREAYESSKTLGEEPTINQTEIRFVVLPKEDKIEDFPELKALEISELSNEICFLSDKMVIGTTGKNGEIMAEFVNQLKSLNKTSFKSK